MIKVLTGALTIHLYLSVNESKIISETRLSQQDQTGVKLITVHGMQDVHIDIVIGKYSRKGKNV